MRTARVKRWAGQEIESARARKSVNWRIVVRTVALRRSGGGGGGGGEKGVVSWEGRGGSYDASAHMPDSDDAGDKS